MNVVLCSHFIFNDFEGKSVQQQGHFISLWFKHILRNIFLVLLLELF